MHMLQPQPLSLDAELDIEWDWNPWLLNESDSLASVIVTGARGLTISSSSFSFGVVRAWIKLTHPVRIGTILTARCEVTTSNVPPRVDSRVVTFIAAVR